MTRSLLCCSALGFWVVVMGNHPATAQYYYPPQYYSPGGGYGWDSGAATAGESYARGMADVIRARAQARLLTAEARSEAEEARRAYIMNQKLAAEAFVERRELRDRYRETADNTFYKSKERLASYVESKKLQPLTSSEFDPSSGSISWPYLLAQPQDAEVRESISAAFQKRAKEGGLDPAEILETSNEIEAWRNSLSQRRDSYSLSELSSAARFLNRLNAELKGEFD